jgi:hypothetical protein
MSKLKAYSVRDEQSDCDYSTVVFAQTRGKARALALSTDACEWAEFKDVRVLRVPELDECYRGRWEMDWNNPEDRIALVKHGWHCSYEIDDPECESCEAKEWCDRYDERKRESW